jgi:hypothetical protein
VEVVVPQGPHVAYGLLGGEYKPTPGRSTLEVITQYSEMYFGVGDPFESQIAISPEVPVVGLPLELAKPVITGVQDAHMRGAALSPGILTIDCAAYGVFGSYPVFFRALGSVLTALLSREWMSESDLRRVVEEYLSYPGEGHSAPA